MYGILDSSNCHIDVSSSLHGAKCYATRHGYSVVSYRHNSGYMVSVRSEKINGKWSY